MTDESSNSTDDNFTQGQYNDNSGVNSHDTDGKMVANSALAIRNNSRLGRMFRIGIYTTLLNIVTLTIFRFWGRTNFRKQLWSDTTVGGEPLEYTGKAKELFIGFIIAMFTFMLPYLAFIYIGQTFLEPAIFGIILLFVYPVLFVLFGVAIFLARRYHMSRTRLRGIRFAQTGSSWGYGFATLGYYLLTLISLGWFAPAARIRLSKKMWNKAYFGNQQFKFEPTLAAKKEPVYLSFGLLWVGFLIISVLFSVYLVGSEMGNFAIDELPGEANLQEDIPETGELSTAFIVKLYAGILVGGVVFSLFAAWHQAVMIRYIMKSLSVGGVSLSNAIRTRDIFELAITNTLMIVFTLGFGIMPAQMRTWKRIANSSALIGNIDFAEVEQNADKGPSQGEGLADGLDLVGQF